MSNVIFPTLKGLGWPVNRKPYWSTIVATAAAGQETRILNYPFPMEQFELPINHLHGDVRLWYGGGDYQTLQGFFNSRAGAFDSFLFLDPADSYTVTNALCEGLATISGLSAGQGQNFIPGVTGAFPAGDGTSTAFQLYRNLGGAVRPFYDINIGVGGNPTYLSGSSTVTPPSSQIQVYVNGVAVNSGWSVGSTGILTFSSAPASGATVAVDFSYFKRVRFLDDNIDLENFMQSLYRVKKIALKQTWS